MADQELSPREVAAALGDTDVREGVLCRRRRRRLLQFQCQCAPHSPVSTEGHLTSELAFLFGLRRLHCR